MGTARRAVSVLARPTPGGGTILREEGCADPLIRDPGARDLGSVGSQGWLAARYRPYVITVSCALVALAAGVLVPSRPKDAVALVVAAAIVAVVLIRPLAGAFALAVVVPMTSGLASGFPVPHVRLSEALIGIVGVTLVVGARRRHAVPWHTVDWVLLAYGLSWAVLGVVADRSLAEHLSIEDWGTVLGQLQFFLLYRGVRIAVRDERERRLVLGAVVIGTVPVALLAILQELKMPGVAAFIDTLTGGLTGGNAGARTGSLLRATGPFDNWAALAGYLLPILFVVLVLALSGTRLPARRWFLGAGVLAAIAFALTVEQSAIVCGIVGVVVLVRRYDRDGHLTRWVLAGAVIAFIAASPLLVPRLFHELSGSPGTGRIAWVPQTISFRWSVWTKQYLPAIVARPFAGYGVVLPHSIAWPYSESQYVTFLMEGGVAMLAVFVALAWTMFEGTLAAARSDDPQTRALGLALAAAVVAMVVMDFVWPFLSNGGMPQVLWALMALAVPRTRRGPVGTPGGWTQPRASASS